MSHPLDYAVKNLENILKSLPQEEFNKMKMELLSHKDKIKGELSAREYLKFLEDWASNKKAFLGLEDLWHLGVDQLPRNGEYILLQPYIWNNDFTKIKDIYKPILALVIDGFNYDMACAIHYVQYRSPDKSYYYDKKLGKYIYNSPKVEMIYQWCEQENFLILGYWKTKPTFQEVFNAYKKRVAFTNKNFIGNMACS